MIPSDEMARIKALPIVDFLASIGRYPARTTPKEYCYFSPFRNEKTPSFFVNIEKNLFNDFSDTGGDVIKLVMKLNGIDFKTAIEQLCSWSLANRAAIETNQSRDPETKAGIEVKSVGPVSHPALIQYLEGRKIPFLLAANYLKEVHYINQGRTFFSLGFENDLGGFELRNRSFKGSTQPKGARTFKVPGSKAVSLFEGFFDFLSAMVYYRVERPRQSCIVINSTSNLNSTLEELSGYQKIYTYFDNDDSGRKAVEKLIKKNFSIFDQSSIYDGFNDFNAFLMEKQSVSR